MCDSGFDQQRPSASLKGEEKEASSDLPAECLASPLSMHMQVQEPVRPAGRQTEAKLKEKEKLQLVPGLSKSEVGEKEKAKKKATSEMLAGYGVTGGGNAGAGEVKQDTELEKYLNRDYWGSIERQDTGPVISAKTGHGREHGGGHGGHAGAAATESYWCNET